MAPQIFNIEEYRLQAESLHRDLRAGGNAAALRAAKRFKALDAWKTLRLREVLANTDAIRLEDAMEVVACENGFSNWSQLAAETAEMPVVFNTARLFPDKSDVFLNLWFHSYEEAHAAQRAEPDLLLFPHGEQFVLCEPALLGWLGADPRDPDWEKIGRDWARPLDEAARSRLAAKLHQAIR